MPTLQPGGCHTAVIKKCYSQFNYWLARGKSTRRTRCLHSQCAQWDWFSEAFWEVWYQMSYHQPLLPQFLKLSWLKRGLRFCTSVLQPPNELQVQAPAPAPLAAWLWLESAFASCLCRWEAGRPVNHLAPSAASFTTFRAPRGLHKGSNRAWASHMLQPVAWKGKGTIRVRQSQTRRKRCYERANGERWSCLSLAASLLLSSTCRKQKEASQEKKRACSSNWFSIELMGDRQPRLALTEVHSQRTVQAHEMETCPPQNVSRAVYRDDLRGRLVNHQAIWVAGLLAVAVVV